MPSRDDLLQMAADLKAELTESHNRLCELALVFVDSDDGGALASHLVTSTQTVTTWATVYATFGPDAIEATDPLDPAWWRALCKTDNPQHWLEQARLRGMTAAQIRAEAGVKQERKPPFLDVGSTMRRNGENLLFSPDCELPEDTPAECRADLRVRIKEA